jgi:tetratricopeptide (TPR) repeat protein
MTDPLRTDRSAPTADSPERDRDARVEQLLLSGLDHYFAGQYDRAITVWTRVLFLDHGHARARAYMERARSAIAERQRESEELLHTGVEAFGRGDIAAARGLLTSALERGAATDEALALLDRLHRLEPAAAATTYPAPRLDLSPGTRGEAALRLTDPHPSRWRWVSAGIAAGALAAVAGAWLYYRGADLWLSPTTTVRAAVSRDAEPLPVPAASEVALARARTLQAKGQLHDALSALESVPQGDPLWTEARALRAAMQRQLLLGVGAPLDQPRAAGQGDRQ